MIKRKNKVRKNIKTTTKKRGFFWKFVLWMTIFSFVAVLIGAAVAAHIYMKMSRGLPKIASLKDYRPPVITTMYSDDGRKIGEFYRERRIITPLSEMPESLINAFIAAEDARFWKHEGVDVISIFRAFLKNIEAGTIVQGGSTITQQVTKSFLLTPERSYERKLKEAILAYRIDKRFTKKEILFLYLNQIYLGHGSYGVAAAAENYFGKPVKDISLAECAILAGLPRAPSKYSPIHYPEKALDRKAYVIKRMTEEGYIDAAQAQAALDAPLALADRRNWFAEQVPYYAEYVRRRVEEKYGADALYEEGLQIHTAVNIEMQAAARGAVDRGLRELDKRLGYRGPLKHLEPDEITAYIETLKSEQEVAVYKEDEILNGVVTAVDKNKNRVGVNLGPIEGRIGIEDMNWARKPDNKVSPSAGKIRYVHQALKTGDVIQVRVKGKIEGTALYALSLEQAPEVQSALLCLAAGSGYVKAMVGGRDYSESQFNRAVQSRRQPGSAFKPIIYAAALDRGYTPATEIMDNAYVYEDKVHDRTWKPKNYDRKFSGYIPLRTALAKSRNLATINILTDIGIEYVMNYAARLGIESKLNRDFSTALGSSGLPLLELVKAYSVFANGGRLAEPAFITKIVDRDGNVLEDHTVPETEQVIQESTAYIMTSLLESVVQNGTGRRVKALGRPAAGKTGTTNNLHDAWFVGYTPQYVTGVWAGFDQERPLGWRETGSRAASPIWLDFMQIIHENAPVEVFQPPEGVVFTKIDAETGLLPIPESRNVVFECFKEGTVPTEHSPRPGTVANQEQFFKTDL